MHQLLVVVKKAQQGLLLGLQLLAQGVALGQGGAEKCRLVCEVALDIAELPAHQFELGL